MKTHDEIMAATEKLVDALREKCNKHWAKHFSSIDPDPIRIENRSRYLVIHKGSSVYAFVDKTGGTVKGASTQQGDILKPASWKAPEKHSRGNVFNPDNGMGCCGPHGIAYLRGPHYDFDND